MIFALGLIFIEGIQTVVRSGLDPQKAMVAGIAFGIGLGMQHENLLASFLPHPWGTLLGNGITVGAATAILFTVFLSLSSKRPWRIETMLDVSELHRIDEFMQSVAANLGLNAESANRLRSAAEETLEVLSNSYAEASDGKPPRLTVSAQSDGSDVELEFVAVSDDSNIEDRIAYLQDEAETVDEAEISLRLLRHYASSVKHQKYHGLDIVTVRVEGTKS